MAKEKSLSAEEAKEKLTAAKEKLMLAKDTMAAFCKENKLKKSEDYSQHDDAKIAKKWSKLKAEIDEKQARVEKYKGLAKDAKKASSAPVKAKYNYPKGVETGADKKKFRTETRSKAKKAGVSVDEYLSNPEKYASIIAEKSQKKEKSKKEKPGKKAKKEEAASSEKKAKKKKKAPAPAEETPAPAAED